jgi:hypothetical protein
VRDALKGITQRVCLQAICLESELFYSAVSNALYVDAISKNIKSVRKTKTIKAVQQLHEYEKKEITLKDIFDGTFPIYLFGPPPL